MNSTRTAIPVTITAAELARVANRHPDIPQDSLPIAEVPTRDTSGDDTTRVKAPKSVRWASCPFHAPSGKKQLTGLVLLDFGVLVFREHSKSIGKFLVRCPGSGTKWIDPKAAI